MQIKFKLGEFFCGPGGLGYGASLAKVSNKKTNKEYLVEHAWASDYDKDSCDTYKLNVKPKNIYCMPVEEFFPKIDQGVIKLEKFNAFAYGFPCNDFSNVGEQKGLKGKYGPLYSYGVEIMNRYKPDWFIAENVGGIRSANEGSAFKKILDELQNSGDGYNLTTNLYKFEEYGIPQSRHRVVIVGFNKKIYGSNFYFKVPKPNMNLKTAKDALAKPINPKDPNHIFTKNSQQVIDRLSFIKPGQNAFNAKLPKHLELNVKGARLSQIYKRLDPNKPAYTITGSGGGGTHVYHWSEPRALTNRERARLQTFPDNFIFLGNKESQRKQIGMAVPVNGAKIIVEAILKSVADVEYQNIKPNII